MIVIQVHRTSYWTTPQAPVSVNGSPPELLRSRAENQEISLNDYADIDIHIIYSILLYRSLVIVTGLKMEKKMISTRIILLVSCVVLAYFAIWLGDEVNAVYTFVSNQNGFSDVGESLGISFIITIVFVISVASFIVVIYYYCKLNDAKSIQNRVTITLVVVTSVLGFDFSFGLFAGPITKYGDWPWEWTTGLIFLPLLGMVPMVFATTEIIIDLRERHNR